MLWKIYGTSLSIYSGLIFLRSKNKYEYFRSIKYKNHKTLNKNKINLAKSILYYLEKDNME